MSVLLEAEMMIFLPGISCSARVNFTGAYQGNVNFTFSLNPTGR